MHAHSKMKKKKKKKKRKVMHDLSVCMLAAGANVQMKSLDWRWRLLMLL